MSPTRSNGLSYADAGVDIDAGNRLVELIKPIVRETRRPGADGEIGGFGGLFDLRAAGFADPILVAANDGVGTKVKVAVESGLHGTVGVDLVAMCVNDLVVQGAEPLFFLDYYATGALDPRDATAVVRGIAEGCKLAGCVLLGGETAEMPGLYAGRDYDLAGFAVGAAERGRLLPRPGMAPGCAVLGLPSSGLHSNGFSLVRRIVAETGLGWSDPAPFEPGRTLAEALLTPTRIYVRPVLDVLRGTPGLLALAHVTGGGFPDNLPRVLPDGSGIALDGSAWTPPPVFGWLARAGGVADSEMLRTFNCGIGMVAIVRRDDLSAVTAAFAAAGQPALEIGEVVAADGPGRVVMREPVRFP